MLYSLGTFKNSIDITKLEENIYCLKVFLSPAFKIMNKHNFLVAHNELKKMYLLEKSPLKQTLSFYKNLVLSTASYKVHHNSPAR